MYLPFITLISCSGFLVPAWYDTATNKDKVSRIEDKQIIVYTENIEVTDKHLVFDVEIINKTKYPLYYDPQEWYYLSAMNPFPTGVENTPGFEDPLEKKYALSEKQVTESMYQTIQSQRNSVILLNVLSVGLVIFDAAMDVKDMNAKEWTPRRERAAVTRDWVTLAGVAAADVALQEAGKGISEGREDLFFLGGEILQKGSAGEGESKRGKVFFPIKRDKYYRLIIVIGGIEYAFDYRWAEYEEMAKFNSKE